MVISYYSIFIIILSICKLTWHFSNVRHTIFNAALIVTVGQQFFETAFVDHILHVFEILEVFSSSDTTELILKLQSYDRTALLELEFIDYGKHLVVILCQSI